MSLRRAVGALLARISFSPPATPTTAAPRSVRPLRGLSIAPRAAVAAAALAGGGALAYFKKGPDDIDDPSSKEDRENATFLAAKEKTAHNKEEDIKAIFEDWIKRHNKSYHDEEEKALRFRLFKAALDKFPRPLEQISYFADWTREETRMLLAYPDGIMHHEEFQRHSMDLAEKIKKGELGMFSLDVKQGKQGDTRATQVSA